MTVNVNITRVQKKFLDDYLKRSGDKLNDFLTGYEEPLNVLEYEGIGWVEYLVQDNVFWIPSAYSCKSHKETKKIWNKVKDIAVDNGCDRIHFMTQRNPKAFERLFNAKVIATKLEVMI